MGNIVCVRVLLSYKANVEGGGGPCNSRYKYENGDISYMYKRKHDTPLSVAAEHGQIGVMSCLVEYGADVDAVTKKNYTPLMMAVKRMHENAFNFLIDHGAKLDLQDENGNTALHHAIKCGFYAAVHKLLDFGASLQLYNKDRLTPLQLASDEDSPFMVEELINRPECTKEQSIDALELLGASIACKKFAEIPVFCPRAFEYMMRGMRERFKDHLNPLFKHVMEPVEAYQYRKESETLEELAQIEGDGEAIFLEGLIIRERILGTESKVLFKPIEWFASYLYGCCRNFHACIALYRHAIKIKQNCNEPILLNLPVERLFGVLDYMGKHDLSLAQKVVLDVLQEAILEYEKLTEKVKKSALEFEGSFSLEAGSLGEKYCDDSWVLKYLDKAVYNFCDLLDSLSKAELCEKYKASDLSVLRKLYHINSRDSDGDT